MDLQHLTHMTTEEVKHLEGTLKDISDIAGQANKVFGFVKYLVWAIVGIGGIIAGSGVWVYATNQTLKQHTEIITQMQADAKANAKELNDWRRAKDEIDIKLTDAIVNVSDMLKLHMKYTDPKSVQFDTEGLQRDLRAAVGASVAAPPATHPRNRLLNRLDKSKSLVHDPQRQ